ncbi:MAG: hypothetical protein KUG60_03175 [Gammaproteobacteria bacterium]|nr:hypothetical protein [Gammaproteobacteria bacterium]
MKDYRSALCTVRIYHFSLNGNGSVGATSYIAPVKNVSSTCIIPLYFNKNIILKLFILFFTTSINSAFSDPLSVRTAQQAVTISKNSIQSAFENVSGITRVNVTAGTGNLQQNSSAIATINDGQLNAVAKIKSTQLSNNPSIKNLQIMSAEIGSGAFNGARGITSVNQSAGADNTQLNAMAVAVGGPRPLAIVEMNESQLQGESQPLGLSLTDQAGNTAEVNAVTGLSKSAFNGARGVIQINQAAGSGNLTSNSFTMSVSK